MTDCVAIAPELSFRDQVREVAIHLSRSFPPTEQAAAKEFVAGFQSQVDVPEGQEIAEETRKSVVRTLVGKLSELRGALEATKEFEAESAHLLIGYLISSTFEGVKYETAVKTVIQAVKTGGEAAYAAGRPSKLDIACRILNNTYNYLPASSSLRPHALLALLSLLAVSSDLNALPITPAYLNTALAAWSISTEDKIAFLTSASSIYQSAGDLGRALQLYTLALGLATDAQLVQQALVLALADQKRFDLEDVLRIPGVAQGINGETKEIVSLFTDADEVEAVKKGSEWVKAHGAWIASQGVSQLSSEGLLRKLRLIALVTLASRTATKQLRYAEIAEALSIPNTDVEAWVIDAIRADLLKARLSQPSALVSIQSVSSVGSRRFGASEWQLLERRLGEWKKTVSDARTAVAEAEALAAQGPITNQRRQGGGGQQQAQQAPREEVAA